MFLINNNKQKDEELVNENIRFRELLVIGADGTKLGVLTRNQALGRAQEAGLDLVVMAPDAKPPVAKIMDYSKYRFEQKKKLKEIKKNQKVTQVKEVQLSPVIEKHDLETKANTAKKFITKDGNKVKVTLRFRGRMIVHQDLGIKVMQDFADSLSDVAQIDSPIKLEARSLIMVLGPKKEK